VDGPPRPLPKRPCSHVVPDRPPPARPWCTARAGPRAPHPSGLRSRGRAAVTPCRQPRGTFCGVPRIDPRSGSGTRKARSGKTTRGSSSLGRPLWSTLGLPLVCRGPLALAPLQRAPRPADALSAAALLSAVRGEPWARPPQDPLSAAPRACRTAHSQQQHYSGQQQQQQQGRQGQGPGAAGASSKVCIP